MGIQPNVILALLAAIFGFSVKIIFLAGVTIVWWRTLKDGTTLATLHYIWNKGMGESMSETLMAVRQSPRAKWVILVFLGVTAVDIWDGAIMQRSVKPVNANLHQDYESIFHLADHIQDGWTGTVSHGFFGNLIWSNWFDGVARILYHGQLPLEKHNCDGTCYGSAIGAGINATCSQSQQILNPPTTRDDHTVVLFGIQANRTVDSRGAPALQLEHRFVKDMDEKCVATIGVESCVIRSGTVLYDLIHRGKNVSLGTDQFPSLRTLKPNNGDLPNAPNGSNAGPLAGIHSFIDMFLSSKVVLHPVDLGIPTSYMRFKHYGTIDTGYYDPPLANETKNDSCPFRYRNATDDILWQLHDMMFRMAADSVLGREEGIGNEDGSWKNWRREFQAFVYDTDHVYLWFASVTMLCSLFAALSLLWGYWELDRKVSLSPLETGRALAGAITTPPTDSLDMGAEKLLALMGARKVR